MKVSVAIVLALALLELASAFSIVPSQRTVLSCSSSTLLRWSIVYPDDDDDDDDGAKHDVDPNSVAYQKEPMTRTQVNTGADAAGPTSLEGYRDIDEFEADEINKDLNVDAFDNQAAGGIMDGFRLSSLCSDD